MMSLLVEEQRGRMSFLGRGTMQVEQMKKHLKQQFRFLLFTEVKVALVH